MRAEVNDDRLVITFHTDVAGPWELKTRHRASGAEASTEAFHAELRGEGGEARISAPITAFNAASHELFLEGPEGLVDLGPALEKYKLNPDLINDHYYMTKSVFGAGHRALPSADLMYLLLCHLETIPPENQFYGGLVSVLCFRVAEDLEKRAGIIEILLKAYDRLEHQPIMRADHAIRWRISSTVNLASLLLYTDRVEEAERVIEAGLCCPRYNAIFPLTYMNFAGVLALAGIIALDRGAYELAHLRFAECADFCTGAVSQLFTLRNNYLFQHEFDVRTLVNLGYQSAAAMAGLSPSKTPVDSKISFPRQAADINKVDFAPAFSRFRSIRGTLPPVVERARIALKSKDSR